MRAVILARWLSGSIRRMLLSVLMPGMLLVFAGEIWLDWHGTLRVINAAYDRSLLGAVKAIDTNITAPQGRLQFVLPYHTLELFQLHANGQVFYRVATEDGQVELGHIGLPAPPQPLVTGRPQFHESVYMGEPVRVSSFARELIAPGGPHKPQRVVIQVAETLKARTDFQRSLLLESIARGVLLVTLASALFGLSIAWAMRPLARLRHDMQARPPQDLTPMDPRSVPAELLPLVTTINQHIARSRNQTQAQRQFLDDASHQLRTPLTTLATQVAFALRETQPSQQRKVLENIRQQLDETIRQTNQMLALAKADSAAPEMESLDAVVLAEDLVRRWWATAREHGIDLGLHAPDTTLPFLGEPGLLKEALSNLLHNAIRYSRAGCHVTLEVARQDEGVRFSVIDNGPGLAPDERARAGERFFRGRQCQHPGSGLGLAIARTVALRHGGNMHVGTGAGQRGLVVSLWLPTIQPRI